MTVHTNHTFENSAYGHLSGNGQTTTWEAQTGGEPHERYVEITVETYGGDFHVELNEEDLLTLLDILKSDKVVPAEE